MKDYRKNSQRHLTFRVTHRDDPVSEVTEQDALQAAERYPHVVLRGPVFGYAVQTPEDGPGWRLLSDVSDGFPQHSRDGLNSHLWFTAKDETAAGDPLREHLLAAVARLETEPVDELTVGDARYRVVRADEFARVGEDGIEGPRPTDPDDPGRDIGDRRRGRDAENRTKGFVVDHGSPTSVMESIQRMELLTLHYQAERIPAPVREDSREALTSHPGVVLLPAAFTFAERKTGSWEPMAGLQATPSEARATLYNYLSAFLPELERDLSPGDAASYASAAEAFRAGPPRFSVEVLGRHFQVIRVERLMRVGPDGPEPPRPSDVDPYGPTGIHPPLHEVEAREARERAGLPAADARDAEPGGPGADG
ncbi:DUF5954 family protein [Streptomyces avicenniae]|uniref:DUF5954 family protein n=1 Tax=Streptomyces avicenniae TaxID=500153 RepID=UPI000ABCC908|nr:DUF5954 family protein [Streptomyces avicenniae]